jgi:hypothetical protein
MSSAKYQNVPQRDSLDEAAPSYSQAPPSYQADNAQEALLRGTPRSEDDNLPDDFKFGGVVAEATLDIRMAFIRKVYAIL